MHLASGFGNNPKFVELLIDRGAEVNALNANGSAHIHTAALFGNVEVARTLLDRGADIEARIAEEKFTPLIASVLGAGSSWLKTLSRVRLSITGYVRDASGWRLNALHRHCVERAGYIARAKRRRAFREESERRERRRQERQE